jgi:hypothetical protein
MKEHIIEESARCFIKRIASPARGSKRVDLLHGKWDRTLVDPAWIRGALQTTALRKRPHGIALPTGSLGYAAGQNVAEKLAGHFWSKVAERKGKSYEGVLLEACSDMENEMSALGLHWTFGRSQKFFNILAKYGFCVAVGHPNQLRDTDESLMLGLRLHLHAPIDSVTLQHVAGIADAPPLMGIYWGWTMTREIYSRIQGSIKRHAEHNNLSTIEYELVEVW